MQNFVYALVRRGGVNGSSFGHRSASGSNLGGSQSASESSFRDGGRQSAGESSFRGRVDSRHQGLEDIEIPVEEATIQTSSINRFTICVEGDGFYPADAHTVISTIMKAKYDKPWNSFTEVPNSVKMMWFEEFKKHCEWEVEDESDIFKIWKCRCAKSLSQSMGDIRRRRTKGIWMSNSVFEALSNRWDTDPEFIERSLRNKKNAAANKHGKVNRSGAISISERVRRYEAKLGRKVSIPEVFQSMNYDEKTDKWFSGEAESIYCKYKKLKDQSSSQGVQVDDSILFLEATGGINKQGRSFGFGSEINRYLCHSRSKGKNKTSHSYINRFEELGNRLDQMENVNARLLAEIAELRSIFIQKKKSTDVDEEAHSSTPLNDDMDDRFDADV